MRSVFAREPAIRSLSRNPTDTSHPLNILNLDLVLQNGSALDHHTVMFTATITTDEAIPNAATVIYVAPDCTDSAVQKRVRGFITAGVDLVSFSFRRNRYNKGFVPEWPNVELGRTTEKRLVGRLKMFLHALRLMMRHRGLFRRASVLYARNLDLAVLALFAKFITRSSNRFVYEVLDVHPAMTAQGVRSIVLRWLERRVLKRCELLVVSSPAFIDCYFQTEQRYRGKSFLLENKWPCDQMFAHSRKLSYQIDASQPRWTIGWFGNIRCPESLRILAELADALPQRVVIYIRGCASLLGEEKLMDVVSGRDNMVYDGQYCAPEELSAIYTGVHFNWCVDLCGGDNSSWLLPNRIYEGGYFGIPAVALADHETGRTVSRRKLGISLPSPLGEHLYGMLLGMSADQYAQLRGKVEALPVTDFVDHGDIDRLIRTVCPEFGADPGRRK
ncbi:MAG: hypothetical protein KDB00_27135 [Planctomycetales bacterium]|nr:hypothetical protein [Planctomycetales bacterium]